MLHYLENLGPDGKQLPIALAHRGFWDPANGEPHLENSMAAFSAAVDLGYRYLETDVHGTDDGVAIALHDETLDRTTDGKGKVSELPWKKVSQFYIGGTEPIPTLEELFAAWPNIKWNIDIKSDSAVEPTAALIEKMRVHDRVLITSFSVQRRRATLKKLSKPVATGAASTEIAAFVAATRMGSKRLASAAVKEVDAIQVPLGQSIGALGGVTVTDAGTVKMAHAIGKVLHVWTVNTQVLMNQLLDLGVDGIFTDRADTLATVLKERNEWPRRLLGR
ncbi:MAG: glycerophosphodiester phosphodiesterase [Promicromonosporaceae bacterium]|nr:glycerophosphodiester phosphodiesterase [Promicromonosporaceae bacterium]